MYINLFAAGIICTVVTEIVIVFGVAVWLYVKSNRKAKHRYTKND